LIASLVLIAAACSSGGSSVTINSFYDIPLGATKPEVIASIGEPYSIHEKSDGTVEYEYVERIKEGARNLEERRYVITLKDGKVVSKKVKQSSPPPYLFDSYEMQTTQKDPHLPAEEAE
jgi:hypothetical protein